jgi:hypothetical protein
MTQLKALSVLHFRAYVLEKHGQEGVALVQAAMSERAQASVYSDHLMATDWIDIAYCLEHGMAFDRVFGSGDGSACAIAIRSITISHSTGLYRAMFQGTTPRAVLEKSSRLWSRYYDRGDSVVEFHSETFATKRILNCPDLPLHHDWFLVPYYEELLRLCGAKEPSARHVKCVALGADCCETEVRWK